MTRTDEPNGGTVKTIIDTRVIDLWTGDQLSNGQVVKGIRLVDETGPLRCEVTVEVPGRGETTETVPYDTTVPVWADVTDESEYRLDDYRATGGNVWIHADGSPWQLRVGDLDGSGDRDLTIILGDCGYHQLRLSEISYRTPEGVAEVAKAYTETGPRAEAEITQLLLAASRLLGGRLSQEVDARRQLEAADESSRLRREERARLYGRLPADDALDGPFVLRFGVHGASRVSEHEYPTLEEAKARGLRWSQSNSTGHYWAQVKDGAGRLVAQWN